MCKCDISKCKARCCYNAPLPSRTYLQNITRVVTPPYFFVNDRNETVTIDDTQLLNSDSMIIPITDLSSTRMHRCPFLTKDLRCNIYENRPGLCQKFGNTEHGEMFGCRDLGAREVSYEEMKVKDILKSYGMFKRMCPQFDIPIEELYKFTVQIPEGTMMDLYKWIKNNKR